MKLIEVYLRIFIHLLRKRGKAQFIKSLEKNVSLLDVGCGNNSPSLSKLLRPDIYYVGVDVVDYNQNKNPREVADEYILTTPDMFSDTIASFQNKFGAVISSHNLEHCNSPNVTLQAMLRAIKIGGRFYLSFPSEASVNFPNRNGLNFYDDSSHLELPRLRDVLEIISSAGFEIDYVTDLYRPRLLKLVGLILEPLSMACSKVMIGTWELYGFESIIWATKTAESPYETPTLNMISKA